MVLKTTWNIVHLLEGYYELALLQFTILPHSWWGEIVAETQAAAALSGSNYCYFATAITKVALKF